MRLAKCSTLTSLYHARESPSNVVIVYWIICTMDNGFWDVLDFQLLGIQPCPYLEVR